MAASRSGPSWRSPACDAGGSAIAESFRNDAARAIAILARALRDLDRAEDAVQEAYLEALERWPRDGFPANPAGWVVATARRRAIDRIRRERRGAEKLAALAALERAAESVPAPDEADDSAPIADERLGLIFACCHPSLALEARVALTLRALGGLSTEEIASAFLVPVATMAQRLVRAKRKIRDAGIPFAIPDAERLPERLDGVCAAVYLIFNQGYAASTGDALVRHDLCDEAVRLARLLAELMPHEPEVLGLLALMLFHDARRDARSDARGELVTLEEQNRSLWHRGEIEEALSLLGRAALANREGPYQLQAAIAAVHAVARDSAHTNWRGIAALYERLATFGDSPVVELNRAVAVAMDAGPAPALALVDRLARDGALDDYHLLHATRADLLRRLGRLSDASAAYERAAALAKNGSERRFLARRLEELRAQEASCEA